MCLAAGQEEADRVTQCVDQGVDFLPMVKGEASGAVTPLGEAVSNSDCFPKLGCRSAGGGLPTQLSLAPCSRPSRPLRVAIAMAATQPVLTAAARDALLLRRVGTEKQRLSRTKKLNCLCIAQDAVALCLS